MGQLANFWDPLFQPFCTEENFDIQCELFIGYNLLVRKMKALLLKKTFCQLLRNLPLLAWTQGQILESHVGLATRSTASVSLKEPLCILKNITDKLWRHILLGKKYDNICGKQRLWRPTFKRPEVIGSNYLSWFH